MPISRDVHTIIHQAANADFDKYKYSQVYASANATVTINGQVVVLAATTVLDILINSISATANVYVLGDKIDTFTGSPHLGSH